MSYGMNHAQHCGCANALRRIVDDLVAAIEQPSSDAWDVQLDAAVTRAKERLSEVGRPDA